jgi:hypothetical protein
VTAIRLIDRSGLATVEKVDPLARFSAARAGDATTKHLQSTINAPSTRHRRDSSATATRHSATETP